MATNQPFKTPARILLVQPTGPQRDEWAALIQSQGAELLSATSQFELVQQLDQLISGTTALAILGSYPMDGFRVADWQCVILGNFLRRHGFTGPMIAVTPDMVVAAAVYQLVPVEVVVTADFLTNWLKDAFADWPASLKRLDPPPIERPAPGNLAAGP